MPNKSTEKGKLTVARKTFAQNYVIDWNATKAYRKAYPNCTTDGCAGVEGHKLLKNPKIQAYIAELTEDIEKQAEISRLMVVLEHKKIAFSSIAHLHDDWVTKKEFDSLSDDEKACISEIQTTKTDKETHVKIKLHDKQKSLDSISKMMGYDAPLKVDHTSDGEKVQFYIPDNGRK